ncbi:uncharacterized protein TM35_000471390 [Trypanosoma theileri]|uniref:Mucin-associated surface protein (MASP) n=1 Tax=Trypanosoma theileri TaxID=67003 RepID=A0A1X0NHK9_9TRYP|nr:uncharacterized protein TM35_000471390 [Trypanosoma theileri]ORC84244.1 hypothetical protein TM35_000471390 [Trypanosoma theileri]
MMGMRYTIFVLVLALCFACGIVCAENPDISEGPPKVKAEEETPGPGGPCTQGDSSCRRPSPAPLSPGPSPGLSPVHPSTPVEPGLVENRVSAESSSPGLGNPGQAAGTLREREENKRLHDSQDGKRVDGGTKEGLVSTQQKEKSKEESEEENKELKDALKQEQDYSIGDRPSTEEPVSQTDANGTTQSTGTPAKGSQSEEPPAPPDQRNTGDASSSSSSAENAVGSDAATDVSNVATSSAASESTRNQNEEGVEGTESTTTTTTTLPPELTNNKKGDADSSSSISSSVWVRVPLLIMVTLACILVC